MGPPFDREPTNKTYEISTFQDIIDKVPHDRIHILMDELGQVLSAAAAVNAVFNAAGIKSDDPSALGFILPFMWTDNGVRQVQVHGLFPKELMEGIVPADFFKTDANGATVFDDDAFMKDTGDTLSRLMKSLSGSTDEPSNPDAPFCITCGTGSKMVNHDGQWHCHGTHVRDD